MKVSDKQKFSAYDYDNFKEWRADHSTRKYLVAPLDPDHELAFGISSVLILRISDGQECVVKDRGDAEDTDDWARFALSRANLV
jgi:hypothetical protein